MMWHGGWSGIDWVLMSLVMLVFWTLVAAGVVWAIAELRRSGRPPSTPTESVPTARAILDERLARGDLTAEEYRSRRDLLNSP